MSNDVREARQQQGRGEEQEGGGGAPGRRMRTAALQRARPRDAAPGEPAAAASAAPGSGHAPAGPHHDPFDYGAEALAGEPVSAPAATPVASPAGGASNERTAPAATPAGAGAGHGHPRGAAAGPAAATPGAAAGQSLRLRWRGDVRASYRGFFQNLSRDPAQIEEWINHILGMPNRWMVGGRDVALSEFERLANERHLVSFPVYGGAIPYIEQVTHMRVPQLRTVNRALDEAERAEAEAETILSQMAHDGDGGQGGAARNGGGNQQAQPGSRLEGEPGTGPATGTGAAPRAPLGAAPSELLGPGQIVVGGRASFQMRVTLGAGDTSDNPLEDSRAIDRGTFRWEVFDATALARGAAPAAPLATEAARLQQGDSQPGGRAVTAADANADERRRIDRALGGDTARAASEYEEARRDGRTTDAILGATSVLLTPTSAAVAYGGYVLNRVVEGLFGTDAERAIPFPDGGTFIVRCIAQPRRLDNTPARPPSVAVHTVTVTEARAMAREALDEPGARLAELELRRDQAADPAARTAAELELTNARTMASGAPTAVIALSRDRLLAESRRLAAQIATVSAQPAGGGDAAFDRQTRLRDLNERQAAIAAQLRQVEQHLQLATTRHAELGGVTFRPRAVIVDQDSGDRLELLLEVSEPLPEPDGYHCTVSDTTSARGGTYPGRGANRAEAIWAAIRALATGNDYGRGQLFVRLPDSVGITGSRDRDFTNAPGSTTLLRQRLADLGTVATALAAVSIPGAGEVAMLVGATTAAANLFSRLNDHTLHLDADSVNDVLNVLTAVAAGAQVVGRLRLDPRAVSGRIALVPVEASRVASVAQGVSTAIDRIQVITTTAGTIEQFNDIARQEAASTISHARARELRARALMGHLQLAWTTAGAPIVRGGGDGTTGNQVPNVPDAPPVAASATHPEPAAASAGTAPAVAHPEPAAATVAAGPRPAGPEAAPADHRDNVDGHRDALVPPAPVTPAAHEAAPAVTPPTPAAHEAAPSPTPAEHPPAAHATGATPTPPVSTDPIEAHQIARMERVVPLILTLPQGTRIVPDATPDPMPAGWMRLSQLSAYLRMLGRLRSAGAGQDVLYGIANRGGVITMNAGRGHYQSGNHINIDPSVHTTATGRAGMTGHEGDHLIRGAAPVPAAHATEDSYVAAVMRHEALAQARLFEVRRAIGEASGGFAANGSGVREYGAHAYYSAYNQARAAHLTAHTGDTEGAHSAGIWAGVHALEGMWGTVPVSIPGAGTYDQYARRNYRAAHPTAATPTAATPTAATPTAATPTAATPTAGLHPSHHVPTQPPPAPTTGLHPSHHVPTQPPPAPATAADPSFQTPTLVPPAPATAADPSFQTPTLVPPAPPTPVAAQAPTEPAPATRATLPGVAPPRNHQ